MDLGPVSSQLTLLLILLLPADQDADNYAGGNDQGRLPELRQELLDRAAADQDARERLVSLSAASGRTLAEVIASPSNSDLKYIKQLKSVDSENSARLASILREYGWPSKSMVGKAGERAAWLLAQHASSHELQKKCLRALEALPDAQSSAPFIAYLTDRIRLAEGKKQLYGTQLEYRNGKLELRPIQDESKLHLRRQKMGLPPIEVYLKVAREGYAGSIPAR